MDWQAQEPGLKELVAEIAHLFRRGRRRIVLVAVLTLAVTAVVVSRVRSEGKIFHAHASVRVTEVTSIDGSRASWSTRNLYVRIEEIAFSKPNMRRVMRQFGHRQTDDFRSTFDVEVVQNPGVALVEDSKKRPRSAYVLITSTTRDQESADATAQVVAHLVIDVSGSERRVALQRDLRTKELALAQARSDLAEAIRETHAGVLARRTLLPLRVRTEVAGLRSSVSTLEGQVGSLRLRVAAEGSGWGLDTELLQLRPESDPLPLAWRAAGAGAGAFLVGLPILLLLVGLFDTRVYFEEDVRRLGLLPLARLRMIKRLPAPPPGRSG